MQGTVVVTLLVRGTVYYRLLILTSEGASLLGGTSLPFTLFRKHKYDSFKIKVSFGVAPLLSEFNDTSFFQFALNH